MGKPSPNSSNASRDTAIRSTFPSMSASSRACAPRMNVSANGIPASSNAARSPVASPSYRREYGSGIAASIVPSPASCHSPARSTSRR